MIFTEQPLSNIMPSSGAACFINTPIPLTEKPGAPTIDFCICKYRCKFVELAFAEQSGDQNKNDKTSILITLQDSAGSFTFKLISADGTETLLNDNTYGEFFDLGTLAQPLKAGYIIDWLKVFNTLGPGLYQIEAQTTNFSVIETGESHIYKCTQFSDDQADETIRIKTVNSGCILNGIDYTGLAWPRSVRIPGKLQEVAPEQETINSVTSSREILQVQESTRDKYEVRTGMIPSSVYDLIKNDLKANQISLDAYDLFGFRKYRNLKVTLEEIDELKTDFQLTDYAALGLTFKSQILELKRNI